MKSAAQPNLEKLTDSLSTVFGDTVIVTLTATVVNNGTTASENTEVAFYIHYTAGLDTCQRGSLPLPALAPDSSATIVWSYDHCAYTPPCNDDAPQFFVAYQIDYQDLVTESDESDNWVYNDSLIVVDCFVGINDPEFFESMFIAPNPNNGRFILSFPDLPHENGEVNLLDAAGKKLSTLYNGNMEELITKQFDLSSKDDGLYFIELISDQGIVTRKMIIAKEE